MLTNTHIVARSGNAKTGVMPVTYRTSDTCPRSCPFLPTSEGGNGGCYGAGRIFGIAGKYASQLSEADAAAKLQGAPKDAKYLRDRVVGDLVAPDGSFDHAYVASIARVAGDAGLVPYGYTHAWPTMTTGDVERVADTGYVLNASCETEADIERAVSLGMPTVVARDDWEDGDVVAGRRIVTCPAQTREDVTCASCGLCAKPNRAATVRFLLHGSGKGQAARSVAAQDTAEGNA